MASTGESSSAPMEWSEEKPVVVRVKRKAFQSRLDAFWLEINERPTKRALFDFQKLSIGGESTNERVEDFKKRKVFVQHVETVSSSEATIERLQSLVPCSADAVEGISKSEEWKEIVKKDRKKEELFSTKARDQEIHGDENQLKEMTKVKDIGNLCKEIAIFAQNARFEQIRRTSGVSKEASHDKVKEICHFYDVVRVDVEERSSVVQEKVISLEDQRILSSYLPLLREFIPSAVDDIESDIHDYVSKTEEYVYDYYTVTDDMDLDDEASLSPFPLVTVEEEEFYDGPDDESDYESEDSNAEAHPRNEYPYETSEEEEEEESEEVANVSEEDEGDDVSSTYSELKESKDGFCEDKIYYDDCAFDYEDDINSGYDDVSGEDDEDWR